MYLQSPFCGFGSSPSTSCPPESVEDKENVSPAKCLFRNADRIRCSSPLAEAKTTFVVGADDTNSQVLFRLNRDKNYAVKCMSCGICVVSRTCFILLYRIVESVLTCLQNHRMGSNSPSLQHQDDTECSATMPLTRHSSTLLWRRVRRSRENSAYCLPHPHQSDPVM